jgi:hypothetical protein
LISSRPIYNKKEATVEITSHPTGMETSGSVDWGLLEALWPIPSCVDLLASLSSLASSICPENRTFVSSAAI